MQTWKWEEDMENGDGRSRKDEAQGLFLARKYKACSKFSTVMSPAITFVSIYSPARA